MPAGSLEHIGRRLDEIPEDLLPIEQLILVAGLLALAFEDRGLRPVVVGGVAVAIYTERVEATVDVDFVVEGRLAAIECLEQLGFERGRSAGVFWYPRLRVPVEIPDTVLAGDYSRVVEITLHNGLMVPVIGIDDLILDRAEQAAAQGSPMSDARRQAILLIGTHWNELDWDYLETGAAKRSVHDYLAALKTEADKLRRE